MVPALPEGGENQDPFLLLGRDPSPGLASRVRFLPCLASLSPSPAWGRQFPENVATWGELQGIFRSQ